MREKPGEGLTEGLSGKGSHGIVPQRPFIFSEYIRFRGYCSYLEFLCIFTQKFDIYMKLNRIKDVLDEKGISQTWLANKLGKSFNSVNSYVCNRTQPNLETLLHISKILQIDMRDLISDAEERNS